MIQTPDIFMSPGLRRLAGYAVAVILIWMCLAVAVLLLFGCGAGGQEDAPTKTRAVAHVTTEWTMAGTFVDGGTILGTLAYQLPISSRADLDGGPVGPTFAYALEDWNVQVADVAFPPDAGLPIVLFFSRASASMPCPRNCLFESDSLITLSLDNQEQTLALLFVLPGEPVDRPPQRASDWGEIVKGGAFLFYQPVTPEGPHVLEVHEVRLTRLS